MGGSGGSSMSTALTTRSKIGAASSAINGRMSMDNGAFLPEAPLSGLHSESSIYGPRMPRMQRQQQPDASSGGGFQPHDEQLLQLGIPRVPTAPSLQAVQDSLKNHEAAKNLEAFIRSAQSSIQQTAANCQQNLQSLTTMIQHNPGLKNARWG